MSMAKDKLHELVDELPEEETPAAQRFLEYLRDVKKKSSTFKNAPIDDEPLTKEELDAIHEAEKAINNGETKDLEEFKREYGL